MSLTEEDIFIPLYISQILLQEDHCTHYWYHNPVGVSGIALESSEKSSAFLKFKTGNIYEGEVHKGKLHGEGKMEFTDGIVYEGEFKHNRIEGKGRITWPDGSYYKGQFLNGVRNGHGEYRNPIKDVTYRGEWNMGQRHGKGELRLNDGSLYNGLFISGLKQGFGKLVYPSGNTYQGEWKFNKKNGKGVMHWYDSNQKYDGDWKDDIPNGIGTLIWLEEKGYAKLLRNRYSGEFKNGLRNGLGVFYYANGSTYEGQWLGNTKHGYGVFNDENGNATYGWFEKDRIVRKINVMNTLLDTLVKKTYSSSQMNKDVDNKIRRISIHLSALSKKTNGFFSQFAAPGANPGNPVPRIPGFQHSTSNNNNNLNNENESSVAQANPPESLNNSNKKPRRFGSKNRQETSESGKKNQQPKVKNEELKPAEELDISQANFTKRSSKNPNYLKTTGKNKTKSVFSGGGGRRKSRANEVVNADIDAKGFDKIEEDKIEIRSNIYNSIVKVKDFINDEGKEGIHKKLCEIMLRHHSSIKEWYKIYAAKNSKNYEEGFFLSMSSFWQMLSDCRLLNGRLNLINFCKLFARYQTKSFDLHFDEDVVKEQIELIKRYDFKAKEGGMGLPSPLGEGGLRISSHSFITQDFDGADEEKDLEVKIKQLLLDKYKANLKRAANTYNPDQVILHRFFVNGLVRAIHLKTGSIHHLPEQISKIFKNRLNPIITGKLRPKVIVSEDANIIQKSAKIMEIYRPSFERIYNVKRSISACHQKGKFLDLKSFIDIMVESGLLVYEGIEKRKIVWMIMERNQDPEESIFKIILKIVKREGRSHHYLEGNIAKLILQKLQAELSLSQFEHLFVVLFCKMVGLNSRDQSFERKLKYYLDSFMPTIFSSMEYLQRRRAKKRRYFPETQKDRNVADINKIREERLRMLKLKREKQIRLKKEAQEREMMRSEDYDVTDFLAGMLNFTATTSTETEADLYIDDNSFFEQVDPLA